MTTHFQGTDTPFTLANYASMLALILIYTAITSWIFVLGARFIRPHLDELGRKNYFWGPVYLLMVVVSGFVVYNYFPVLLVIIVPVMVVAAFLGLVQNWAMTMIMFGIVMLCFAAVWYPFGALTGIGWVGMLAYPYLCFKSFDFYV
jgi:hypothetical protein